MSTCTGNNFIETNFPMYFGFTFYVENFIEPYCYEEVSDLVPFNSELQTYQRRHGDDENKLVVRQDDGALFAPGNPFHLCSKLTHFTPSISSTEQELQEIVEREANENQWMTLFSTHKLIGRDTRILQPDKTQKWRMNQALADCNSSRKQRAPDKLF